MASRAYQLLRILGMGRVEVQGTFFPQGPQAAGFSMPITGKGFSSVIYTATTGIYQIQLTDKYFAYYGLFATPQNVNTEDWTIVGSTYDPNANTILVHTRRAGSLTAMTADPSNFVAFRIMFSNSSIGY